MEFDDPLKPYEIPATWTSDHVMMRMIWAFEDLSRVKMRVGPAGYGSGWPKYVHDWEDQLAQEEPAPGETQSEAAKRRAGDQKPIVLPPRREELSKMEEALWWPVRYLANREVQITKWALRRARGAEDGAKSIEGVHAEAGIISAGLIRDRVVVR